MPAEAITREILGGIPSWMVFAFYVFVIGALAWASIQFFVRFRKRSEARGRPSEVVITPRQRLGSLLRFLIFHERLLEDRYAGIAHLLVFYGFLILFGGTCIVFLESETPLHFFYGRFYEIASLIIDLGGLAFMVGLGMFLWRRRPGEGGRWLSRWWVSVLGLLLFIIGLSGFLLEGARIAVDLPTFEKWSPVGYSLALGFQSLGIEGARAESFHTFLWVGHAAVCIVFFALLPWMFFSHIVYGAATVSARRRNPLAQLRTPALDEGESGALHAMAFNSRDLLQADACTTCGRCNAVCPAQSAGKELSPRSVVLELRSALERSDAESSLGDLRVSPHAIWSCTTCGACNEACPVGIDVFDKVVEIRRGYVESGDVPDPAATLFERTLSDFNPFGKPNSERLAWSTDPDLKVAESGEEISLLYWVGCAGSFDPDGASVSRAMIRILDHLQIPYRVLGTEERCTGDPARRMGEEGIFQDCARHNMALFASHGVKRILTHCPHCFNTLKNEYPEFGADFEVEHHTQFLARQIREGRLQSVDQPSEDLSFHDPCYLGRGNDDLRSARAVLDAFASGVRREMPRHGKESFCCGGGGGSLWLDERGRERIEDLRAAEAVDTAPTVVTGCPYCKTMLEAGASSLEEDRPLQVTDLAEWVSARLPLEGEE
ncbi:MAG: (Fe-S)-binding protein [Myxococcota bacterium]|nr:(Fe-S)-binding protein [Myxococcota bacterium]